MGRLLTRGVFEDQHLCREPKKVGLGRGRMKSRCSTNKATAALPGSSLRAMTRSE